MRFAFTEDQEALRRSARRFLDEHAAPKKVRAAMASERGFDKEIWARMAQELGWTSLIIPEAYGGVGLGAVELCALMEEMGRALLCAPFFSTVCLATHALLLGGTEAQKQEHLPRIAAGELTAALALGEPQGDGAAGDPVAVAIGQAAIPRVTTVARREGGDYLLHGSKSYVIDGHTADLLLVVARSDDRASAAAVAHGDDDLALFLVPGDAPGLSRRALATMDLTRKQAELKLDGVRVPASSRLGGAQPSSRILARTLDRAIAALAAEQVGGAQKCMEMSVDYGKTRVQFGRAIGSFQAIKHKCADMLLAVEPARSAAYYAGWAAASSDEDLPLAASQAKAFASDAYLHCAAETLQIHGGIGFTWEHDAHLYFKRARGSAALLGDASHHRERFARALGL